MLENIKSELDTLKKAHQEKMDFLTQLRNTLMQTEAEIHQLNGAMAMCEKLMVTAATEKNDDRKAK
jgi:prefoldin subunit 5